MKQAELVSALINFNRTHRVSRPGDTRGQATFAMFLATYIDGLSIPADQEYSFWDIDDYIPQIVLGAIRAFEESDELWIADFRSAYEEETELQFTDPTRVSAGNNIHETLTVEMIKNLFRDIMGQRGVYLSHQIDILLNAERHMVMLRFLQFQDQVYNLGGLGEFIAKSSSRGMSGRFGDTSLRSYVIAGRLMLTFSRGVGNDENSVSFVTDDEDLLGIEGGLQSCFASLPEALAMIQDVITNWEASKSSFGDDKAVAIG